MSIKQRQNGFTIVELLIATAVFSVVLLVISAGIIQIGRLYYKGITAARTQEVARTVMNDISDNIQFNSGVVVGTDTNILSYGNGSSRAVCVATKHYSYKLGQQRSGSNHALVMNDVPSGCSTTVAQNLSSTTPPIVGSELLGDKMRLANLAVEPQGTTNSYRIVVRVVYGDKEVVCDPGASTGPSSCTSEQSMTEADIAGVRNLSCKNIRTGTQFCAMSELSTIVKRRISDD